MTIFDWSKQKNNKLIETRGISFERVVDAVYKGNVILEVPHPNGIKYPNQWILVVLIDGYTYVVPFVKDENSIYFLKTVFKDRRYLSLVSKKNEK